MLVCPACNASNPDDHTFCGYCGSRLSVPSQEQHAPPWLNAADDPTPREASTSSAHTETAHNGSSPSHTDQVVSGTEEAPSSPQVLETTYVASQPASTTLQQPTANEQIDQSMASDDLPDWLRDPAPQQLSENAVSATTAPTLSADSKVIIDIPAKRPTDASQRDEPSDQHSLPPWLDQSTEASDSAAWEPPAWLADDTPANKSTSDSGTSVTEAPAQATSGEEALPDWLRDVDLPSGSARATPPLGSPVAGDVEAQSSVQTGVSQDDRNPVDVQDPNNLATWLPASQPNDAATSTRVGAADTVEELPEWLREDTTAPAPREQGTDELAAWLRDDASQKTDLPQEPRAGSSQGAAQDNGRTMDNGSPSVHQSPAKVTTTYATSASAQDQATPTRETAAQEGKEGLPAWLRGEQDDALPEQGADEPALTPEEQAALPDWLHDDPAPSAVGAESNRSTVGGAARMQPAQRAPASPTRQQQSNDIVSILRSSAVPKAGQPPATRAKTSSTTPDSMPAATEAPRSRRGTTLAAMLLILLVIAVVAVGVWAWQAGLIP